MSYEAWRISFQNSEQAAKAAYKEWKYSLHSLLIAADIAVKHASDDQAAYEAKKAILNLLDHGSEEPARVGWEE